MTDEEKAKVLNRRLPTMVDRFTHDLAFTAPELYRMRTDNLKAEIKQEVNDAFGIDPEATPSSE